MAKITVDREKGFEDVITVTQNDTIDTLKEKIALAKKTIPSHIRIRPDVIDPEVDEYVVRTLENELKRIKTVQELLEKYRAISENYPSVKIKEIAIMWTGTHGYPRDADDLVAMKTLARETFSDVEVFRRQRKELEDRMASQRFELKAKVEDRSLFEQWLEKQDSSLALGDFRITDIQYDVTVSVQEKSEETAEIPLISVFDRVTVSKFIPYVAYFDPTKLSEDEEHGLTYYKAYVDRYRGFDIPQDWTLPAFEDRPHIVFRVLKTSMEREGAKAPTVQDYSLVIWEGNRIAFDVSLSEGMTEDDMERRLFDAIDTVDIKVIEKNRISFKGNYEIQMSDFYKVAFLELVTNHPTISFILFLNESGAKTALMKSRLYVYFYPQRIKDVDKAMSVILTHEPGTGVRPSILRIRLSRVKDDSQIREFSKIFSKILGYYDDTKDAIMEMYREFIPNLEVAVEGKKVKKTRAKKTGKRMDALQAYDPDMFRESMYARHICQKPFQPYVVPEDQVEDYIETYGPNKILEFPAKGDLRRKKGFGHFACDPREPTDVKSDKPSVYPGVRVNRVTKAKRAKPLTPEEMQAAQEYEKSHPYLPCCYPVNQYDKTGGKWAQYLKGLRGVGPSEEESKKITYVKTIPDKQVPTDREGVLVQNIVYLLTQREEIKKSKKGETKKSDSVMRYGVVDSPNSFLHCLELAFNEAYFDLDEEEREEHIRSVRRNLTKTVSAASAKQEMYDYRLIDIVMRIRDVESYFDPDLFIRLAEYAYGCNIFVFVVDAQNPSGNFSMPHHENGYALREFDSSKPTVVIVKMENQNPMWPYRCEIVRDAKSFTIRSPGIVNGLAAAYYEFFSQYEIIARLNSNIRIEKIQPQKTSKLLNDAMSQRISTDGKTFALTYPDGITIVTPPSAPLNIPLINVTRIASAQRAREFAKEYGLQILEELPGRLYFKNKSFSRAYIVISQKSESLAISTRTSLLENFKINRRIAMFLKEYAMKMYAESGSLEFKIDRTHVYDIETLGPIFDMTNTTLFDGEKLIVPSEVTEDRLRYHVTMKVENVEGILDEYKSSNIIQNYYQTVADFVHKSNTIISTSANDLLYRSTVSAQVSHDIEISDIIDPEATEPYFFSNHRINKGAIAIVQNVRDGDLARALNVSRTWKNYAINTGFETPPLPERTEIDFDEISIDTPVDEVSQEITVFKYMDGRYAAIIFFG